MSAPSGFVIWRGPSPVDGQPIVFIATGVGPRRSANRKTGDMVQTWILREDIAPLAAIRADEDFSICGACPHRGRTDSTGRRIARSCYVNAGQAPTSIWQAYRRGAYPRISWARIGELLAGRRVRLGAYGDPAMVPLAVVARLAQASDGWTGYTHQWRWCDRGFADYVMASADSVADRREARLMGYRSFVVLPVGADAPDRSTLCLSVARGTSCADCRACGGTREGTVTGVDIYIHAHGAGAKHVVG